MADQEFLASFGVEIDETGLLRLQEALTKNRALADDLAGAFNRVQEAMTSFFESMNEITTKSPCRRWTSVPAGSQEKLHTD